MTPRFLTDPTIATSGRTATPYARFKGIAAWWGCHLVKEPHPDAPDGYLYVDLDNCAYEDSNDYNRPSRQLLQPPEPAPGVDQLLQRHLAIPRGQAGRRRRRLRQGRPRPSRRCGGHLDLIHRGRHHLHRHGELSCFKV